MVTRVQRIESLEDLRSFVSRTICDAEQLVPGAFPISEKILTRRGKPCGIHFCLHGPRSVKLSAIWETDHHRILFYDATGERFHRTQLVSTESLEVN